MSKLGDNDRGDKAVNCDLDPKSQFHLSWFDDHFEKGNDDCANEVKYHDQIMKYHFGLEREGFLPDFSLPRPGQAVQLLQHLLQLRLRLRRHEHCHCSHSWKAGQASHLSGEILMSKNKQKKLACRITISGLSPLLTKCSNTATSSSNKAP